MPGFCTRPRDAVGRKLFKSELYREYPNSNPSEGDRQKFEEIQDRMLLSIVDMLDSFFLQIDNTFSSAERRDFSSRNVDSRTRIIASIAVRMQKLSDQISRNGYVRAQLTSDMIGKKLRAISIVIDDDLPALSKVLIPEDTRFEIDVLKHLTFELHIKSQRLKLIEYRGNQIVRELFECFDNDEHGELLPHDWRDRLHSIASFGEGKEMRKRLVCDFIAGMTDASALDVYSRLKTTNPSALFRPF